MTGQANPRLRHGDLNQRWVRACPNPILTEAHFGAVAFGVLLVLSVLFAAEAGLFAIAFGCSAAVLVWLSLRAARMGVYINRDGVLVRRFWGRKVGVAWEAIERFEVTRRNRNGAEVDQVRLLANGTGLWLPLVFSNVATERGLQQDGAGIARSLNQILQERTGGSGHT